MLSVRSFLASIPYARVIKRKFDSICLPKKSNVSFPRDRGVPEHARRNHKHYPPSCDQTNSDGTFVFYRIIGNDLEPRHKKGQSRENLAFILKNEPDLIDCEKRFVVNRIVDKSEEKRILEMLEEAGYPYIHIPFDWAEYRKIGWDAPVQPASAQLSVSSFFEPLSSTRRAFLARLYRLKNNYVMNNNGARNVALCDGKARARWVLPWDGNCYLTECAWREIRESVLKGSSVPYHIVPMARISDNELLLDPGFTPAATEEPQIIFRNDAREEFDPEFCYGRRPKVEFFWRLGVPGDWDHWPIEHWDLPCPEYSRDAGHYSISGWVARLFSGKPHLEKQKDRVSTVARGESRNEAIMDMLDLLDAESRSAHLDPDRLLFVPKGSRDNFPQAILSKLRSAALEALARGPFSVVDKQSLPPSGNPNDYWHPAPYYWPNPLKIPGLPFVRRDGHRVPGTRMYEPESERYDRTRVQRLFDDVYILALAWREFSDPRYGEHGARLVRHWFLNPETAMTPHLNYAQVRRGHNRNLGACSGIIEFKDLYYFLDAVRILKANEFLDHVECLGFQAWLNTYLQWLMTSSQGIEERSQENNHGTFYDLQVAAICAFLGEEKILRQTLRDSRFRILSQFAADGAQPFELQRRTAAHYCCFNLQGWIHLAQLADSVGEDLWDFTGKDGRGIKKGMEWLLANNPQEWSYSQVEAFDMERLLPIAYWYQKKYGSSGNIASFDFPEASSVKSLFHPHDGIMPFWNLTAPGVDADSKQFVANEALLE